MMALLALRPWLAGTLALALAGFGFSLYRSYQAGQAAKAKVEQLERRQQAQRVLQEALRESMVEQRETQALVREVPKRELTKQEEDIVRRIFP